MSTGRFPHEGADANEFIRNVHNSEVVPPSAEQAGPNLICAVTTVLRKDVTQRTVSLGKLKQCLNQDINAAESKSQLIQWVDEFLGNRKQTTI